MTRQDAEVLMLRAEVERLRADADRYRWLRNRTYKDGGRLCCEGPDVDEMAFGFAGDGLDAAIDAAIDAARKEQK